MKRILVMGALGQIGSELVDTLRQQYGADNVVASDIKPSSADWGPFEVHDCLDGEKTLNIVKSHQIDTIYHLPALLSATSEKQPMVAWNLNINGLLTTLEVARITNAAVFTPSSIGAFGPTTPHHHTPQDTIMQPTKIYGITKVTGELLCNYYFEKYGVDTRGLRYPGLISYKTPPGGGTTDYAVDIFHHAIKTNHYNCFLSADTYLDMMYIPDAIQAAIQLMEADPTRLKVRNAYNVTAMSICPETLAAAIRAHQPGFTIDYTIDPVRQAIANSWPNSLDDSVATTEWNWKPTYTLDAMVKDMLHHLKEIHCATR